MADAPAIAVSHLARVIREGVKEDLVRAEPHPVWTRMRALGTELWLDTGDIDQATKLWSAEFTALTTNNSLLNKEIQKGAYDHWIPQAADAAREDRPGISDRDLVLEIAFALNARHGLRLVEHFGAYVSVELHTDLAEDLERSVAYGRRYHALCPDRFLVKVPLTPAGLLAARRLEDEGVPVNFTLGFSARENFLITCVARPSWVNVFLGRLNSYVADEKLGDGALVGERACLASQRVVQDLRGRLGVSTRQIAASLRGGEQVGLLAGVDVHTMPIAVAEGFVKTADPGALRDRTPEDYAPRWAAGVDPAHEGLEDLWRLSDGFRAACLHLSSEDPADLSPQGIVDRLHEAGQGSVFPRLLPEERKALAAGGKIPRRARWKDSVASGRAGLDALFTLAGLYSFAQDQAALDERIRGQI